MLYYLNLSGQDRIPEFYYNARENVVLAQSGLNIRSKPDLASEKVGKIPFGERVQILHRDHYGYQKLNTINTEKKEYKIDGFWQKIRYKKTDGYVLSTFLYNADKYEEQRKYDKYVLLIPGSGCTDNVYNIHEYNWHGLYVTGDSSSFKKVSFDYYNTSDPMLNMKIVCKNDQDLKYIIGHKKPMQEYAYKTITKKMDFNPFEFKPYPCDTTLQLTKNIITEYEVEEKGGENGNFKLYIKILDGTWQKLNPFEKNIFYFHDIDFVGDIDSDGIDDCIITYGSKPGLVVLFLSSEAKGEIIKDVASFIITYCC